MVTLIFLFTAFHVGFNLYLLIGWRKIAISEPYQSDVSISVIVPVRNEEDVIAKILSCLAFQEYPKDQFEVIVVNDFSEDHTLKEIQKCLTKLAINIKVISLSEKKETGKKHAITKGVKEARYNYILTTDADCQMGPLWLASYANHFKISKFIAGPVALKGDGLFASLQQVEFAGLMGFGAVTMEQNNPSMCSGANLGFSKEAFEEVGGYADNIQIPSGDDEFLLYHILKRYPGKAKFLKNKAAIVLTSTHDAIGGFINQRKRWTSKWKYHRNWKLRMMAILFFMDYLSLLGIFFAVGWGMLVPIVAAVLIMFRIISDYGFIYSVNRFLGFRKTLLPVLLLQIIYPLHVLFMGVNSIFGKYTWKGRKY
ncbi:MAG: glycosyltransferase [Ekhidna sp.]